MFLGIGSKWKNFKPDNEYLLKVKGLDTITKLQSFMNNFQYKWDTINILFWKMLWDSWKMPDQSIKDMFGNCEDSAILAVDVLGRIQGLVNSRFLMFFGYCDNNGKRKLFGHCVIAFIYNNKYSIFSNNELRHGFNNFDEIGHYFYPLGLKWKQVRDWKGNVLENKYKLFGTF